MINQTILAANSSSLLRASRLNGGWQVSRPLAGMHINCLLNDPLSPGTVYIGTQQDGVLVSIDSGDTWRSIGMQGIPVKSLAVSPHQPGLIYAGCKPVSLYRTLDGGESWQELEGMRRARRWWWWSPADPPGLNPYVIALTISPDDPDVILAGIELGGLLRSEDGGLTWSGHRRGAVLDCHSLKFHPFDDSWAYQAGGGGFSISRDGGRTWRKHHAGLTKKYGWMVAADPASPEVCYMSASPMPNPLRGEFIPPGHMGGKARASIFRSVDGAPWEALSGGLPEPQDYMAYALFAPLESPGHLYAGLSSGDIWHSSDHGDTFSRLPVQLDGIHGGMILV